MTNSWLNFQNKKHNRLFKDSERLNSIESAIDWIGIMFSQEMSKLNKSANQISARRGKKERERILKARLEREKYHPVEASDDII